MDLPTIAKEYMSFFLRNLFLVSMLFVTVIASFIGVVLIDGWVGLHTIVFVGDVDLVLSAFVCSLLISIIVIKKRPVLKIRLSDFLSDFVGVYMCIATVLIYGIAEGSLFERGLFSAYLLAFLSVSVVFVITNVVARLLQLRRWSVHSLHNNIMQRILGK
jgi:hypothetical protein